MAIIAVVAVAVIAFAIAAVVIGREARRLDAQPLQPVYRLAEAVEAISAGLAPDAAAELTEADVAEVVRVHLNRLQFDAAAAAPPGDDPSVVDADELQLAVYREARANGFDVTRPHVEAIIVGHLAYLRAIGAIDDVEDG